MPVDLENLPAYHGQLEGDLQGHEGLTGFDSMSAVAREAIERGKTITSLKEEREKMVKIPGENSDDAERNAYSKALGRPDSPDGYEVTRPENMPEDMPYDEAYEKTIRQVAFDNDLSPTQINAVLKANNAYGINIHAEITKAIKEGKEKAVNALKNLWPGDEYGKKTEETFQRANIVAEKIDFPESLGGLNGFKEELKNTGMVDSPVMNFFFNKLFELVGVDDDIFIQGGTGGRKESGPAVFSSYKNMK